MTLHTQHRDGVPFRGRNPCQNVDFDNPVRTLIKRGTPSTQVSLIIVVTREPLQSMWERAVLIKGIVCTYRNGPRIRLKIDRAIVARQSGRNSSFMQFESISSQRMTANLKCGINVASFRSINRVSNEPNQKSSHPQLELWHTECPRGRKQPCSLHLMGPFSVETRCLSLFIRPQQRLQLCESDRVTRHGRRFTPALLLFQRKRNFLCWPVSGRVHPGAERCTIKLSVWKIKEMLFPIFPPSPLWSRKIALFTTNGH